MSHEILISNAPEEYSLEHRPGKYVAADDFILQLDIDSEEALKDFRARWQRILPLYHIHAPGRGFRGQYSVTNSKSSGHYHVVIGLEVPMSVSDRLFLQAILGSDPVRELLSFLRVKAGIADPIVLEVLHAETS